MTHLQPEDYVFNKDKDGNVTAIGLDVDSYLMKGSQLEPSIHIFDSGNSDYHENKNGMKKVSSILKGLAVPCGILYLQQKQITRPVTNNHDEEISTSIMDNLLELANESEDRKKSIPTSHKKTTRKLKKNSQKTTSKAKTTKKSRKK